MAILENCSRCGNQFSASVSSCKVFCDECDGTNEQRRQEEARWKALTVEEKLDELRAMIQSVARQQSWDGRIG